jgi:hypothetical protein
MVHTRSGHAVVHVEASYGRAARKESKRRRQKRKLNLSTNTLPGQIDGVDGSATPQRRTRTRAQIQELTELATPPSATNRVATTPPTTTTRFLRGRLPRCSDFGLNRHFAFEGQRFFFCHPCDLWDARLPDSSTKMSAVSRRYACTAGHLCFSHPTSLRRDYCRTRGIQQADAMAMDASTLLTYSSTTDGEEEQHSNASEEEDCVEENDGITGDCGSATLLGDQTSTTTPAARGGNDNITHHEDSFFVNNQPAAGVGNSVDTSDTERRDMELLLGQQLEQITKLTGKVALLQEQIRAMARANKKLRGAALMRATINTGTSHASNDSFKHEVMEAINDVLGRHSRWGTKRTGALVAQAVWTQDGSVPELLKLARKHFRDNVFTPYNVLKEMDLAGGTLSYEGIDVLRRVETGGLKRFRGSMIPSKSEIKRMAGMVEWFARPFCPYELSQTSKGESVQFDFAKSMLCILRAFHLDDVGKTRSLSVASSIDGASLSKNLSIIAGGIKITDRGARCPLTKKPMLDNPTTMKAQSRNLCIPLQIMMGRETKETFTEFGPLFQFFDNLTSAETLPTEMTGYMPFSCMTNCDLSAQWKGLCKGGATKVHTLPCTGCATESHSLATPNAHLCTRWCHEQSVLDTEWMCFHKPMATPEHVETMQLEVAELITTLNGALEEIQAQSKMVRHDVEVEDPLPSSRTDAASIHYVPMNALERQSFSQLLSNELMLRGLDISGSMELRRESLRESLQREVTVSRLGKEITHGEVKEGAYFLLMHTLPCVLHMENRNGIKLLTMVLIEGLSNAKKKSLYPDVNAAGTRVVRFVSDIERIINTSILGSEDDPCQWMCPFDPKKKEICPITMDNVRTRRIVDSLDTLVDFCVTDESRASLWITSLNNYRTAMILLRKRDDFTNTEIASYQNHADKFFQAWVRLWQIEGITNYIHMIGSGHIADYLYKWKNLYRYSQQGWEAMNSLIKTFFFRRTSHGGGVRGDSKKSRLIPIARWLQRRLVFLCRITESSIRQYAEDHTMPPVFRTQAASLEEDIYE